MCDALPSRILRARRVCRWVQTLSGTPACFRVFGQRSLVPRLCFQGTSRTDVPVGPLTRISTVCSSVLRITRDGGNLRRVFDITTIRDVEFRRRSVCQSSRSCLPVVPVTDTGFEVPWVQKRAEAGCGQCSRGVLVVTGRVLRAGGHCSGFQQHWEYPDA